MIEQTLSLSCQFVPIEYKAKFISKSDDYTLIENKQLIHWFYQKFIQMNIKFPWNFIGQQFDQLNKTSFLIQLTFQLILKNSWIFVIIFILIFLIIIFFISTLKSFVKSHRINYYSKKRKIHQILYKSIYSIFLIGLLLTSILLIWMMINIIQGIFIEKKLRSYIQKSSLELISFMEHTAFITNCFFNSVETIDDRFEFGLNNKTFNINSELKLALKGVSFLTNIFSDLSIHLKKLEKLFYSWSIIRLITIIFIVIFLILCGFVLYLLLKKLHWSRLKSFPYTKLAFILSIIYWIGFVFWFTKLVILLPHVAGACSACNDLKQKQVYNSLLFASTWFNSTFLLVMENKSIDIDQLIEKCQENFYLWSINDFIRLGLLENRIDEYIDIEEIDRNQNSLVIGNKFLNFSKYERYFGHCQILSELHNNFTYQFCHNFVKHLLDYFITSIITVLSHFLLYLITILFRRFIQNHKYQLGRWNFSIRSLPILATKIIK